MLKQPSISKNSTCPLPKNWEEYAIQPVPVAGPLTLQHLLLIIAAAAAGITIFISYFLIFKHLHRYTEPKQQRQIIRIIFTPCVFSSLSAVTIVNYPIVAKYMEPLISLYETFCLAALFLLFVEYVTPDEHTRTNYFAALENRQPKGKFGMSKGYTVIAGGCQIWFERIWFAVFCFVVVDILMAITEEISLATGDWCATSWSPRFAHIWVTIIHTFFLGWAVSGIVFFYVRLKGEAEFARHKPLLKLVSFKLIVFINFVQSIAFGFLNIDASDKVTGYDIKYGIPAALVAVEQIPFAIFFHYAFRSREYHESMKADLAGPRMGTFRAAANAFNPMDLIRGVLKLPAYAPSLFGRKSASGGSRGPNAKFINNDHLEPMSELPPRYGGQAADTANLGYSNTYGSASHLTTAQPQPAVVQQYPAGDYQGGADREYDRLYAPEYSRSRNSSIDEEQRSTRQMV